MTESPQAAEMPHAADRFQFRIRHLLVLTVLTAGLATRARSMDAPYVFKAIVVLYLLSMATYIVLRLPHALRGVQRKTPAWERWRKQRAEMQAEAERRREAHRAQSEKHPTE